MNSGHDSILDNNFICECIHQLDPSGMNTQFPKMLFFVAKQQEEQVDENLHGNQIIQSQTPMMSVINLGTHLVPFFANFFTISLYGYLSTIMYCNN